MESVVVDSMRARFLHLIWIIPLVGLILYSILGIVEEKIYPMTYEDIVMEMAEEYDLQPSLVFAVIRTESKFDKNAVSPAQAKGLMQITDDTFRWAQKRAQQEEMDPDNLFIPQINIRYGCYILTLLSQQFSDLETVLAAYNAGQGKVNQWLQDPNCSDDGKTLKHIPYEETEDYVHRVINTQLRYQKIYNIP